jgi:hypothetical protein
MEHNRAVFEGRIEQAERAARDEVIQLQETVRILREKLERKAAG